MDALVLNKSTNRLARHGQQSKSPKPKEHTITAHARLAGHTGWDDNDLSALKSRSQFGGGVVISSNLNLHELCCSRFFNCNCQRDRTVL